MRTRMPGGEPSTRRVTTLLGARLVIAGAHGPRFVAAEDVGEIARYTPRLAARPELDPSLLFATLAVMPVDWKLTGEYEDRREQAEKSIAARDPRPGDSLNLPACSRGAECSTHYATQGTGGSFRQARAPASFGQARALPRKRQARPYAASPRDLACPDRHSLASSP